MMIVQTLDVPICVGDEGNINFEISSEVVTEKISFIDIERILRVVCAKAKEDL